MIPGAKPFAVAILLFSLAQPAAAADGYAELLQLFSEWRAFEQPPLLDGAPDYRAATVAGRHRELGAWQQRLRAIDIADWPIGQQVDWHLVRAEMNGMDFNARVLRPWQRDPAFYTSIWTYQSDTPAHEGPTHHAAIELWQYDFPLDQDAEARLAGELATIPPLLTQARDNLTGNGRELWLAGIANLREQSDHLEALAGRTAEAGPGFRRALQAALTATDEFVDWLEAEGENKDGPSGIGVDHYTWQLQNVHLVPMTWEDEVRLLRRELDRALASLKQEEHRNRALPPMRAIASQQEWEQRAEASVIRFRDFLRDQQILPPYDYIEPALRGQMGRFVPQQERNFFWTVAHYEPLALWTHWYHWFDLARIEAEPNPSPIRRGALLYNIWDSRAEGMATGFEEIAMRTGLFDATPRSRELVWIMLAQRAARGLGSLYAHANRFTLQEARDFHVAWTPRGWMREDLDLLGFEQLLYLRQPGYGSSYITGKYLIERLMGEEGQRLGEDFSMPEFFARVDRAGVIPVSLIRWQLTGRDDEIRYLMERDPYAYDHPDGRDHADAAPESRRP
jgi:hypothetical protein